MTSLPTDPRAATEQAIAEAFKRMAPDDYKPVPDRPVPMEGGMSEEKSSCPKCGDSMESDKFSDAVCIGPYWFDVHVTACPGCGHIDDDGTRVE